MTNKQQSGQALIGGLILIVFVLIFSSYFLSVSESYLRLFSNSEQANSEIVQETSHYANILNEISINNQNIIAALTVSQDALLRGLESGVNIAFHQPYWLTYSALKNNKNTLDTNTKNIISRLFSSYSLSSARGFFIAKSLAKKNNTLLKKFPLQIQQYFIQSPNSQVLCFTLQARKKYYNSPGILGLPPSAFYHFNMNIEEKNNCAIENRINTLNKILEKSLVMLYSSEKDRILDYSQLDNLSSYKDNQYGILYVDPKQKDNFINSMSFTSSDTISSPEKKFQLIEKTLSKMNFFKDMNLNKEENLKKSPLINEFIITHKFISGSVSNEQFLKSFFYPNWAVTGVYQ
ncbi:MAG: hypothetical protein V4591_12330 [Bdellovibrionota bacterium]